MALGDSNTFVLPSSTDSIAVSRINFNDSHKAILQSFLGSGAPDSTNYVLEGDATTIPDGLIHRSEQEGKTYISDSNFEKANPVFGDNWTRNGITHMLVDSLATMDISLFEVGELFATPASNARLYMKSSNSGTFVDIGLPTSNSLVSSLIVDSAITSGKIANASLSNAVVAASALEGDKIASNTISGIKVLRQSITQDRIANNAITTVKINDQAITTAKVNDLAVTTAKIANNTIVANDIATNAITTNEITNGSVTIAKMDPSLLIDTFSHIIAYGEVDEWNIDLDAKYPYQILDSRVQAQSGSGVYEIRINGTPVTGLDNVAYDTSLNYNVSTGANTVSAGDDVIFVIESDSASDDIMIIINMLRTG